MRAKALPITANCTRFSASHSILAPRSSITLSPRRVGNSAAIAGRSIPGSVFSTNFAIAISAPVLPAETTQSARPSATASIASRMLERRPARSAIDGLASSSTTSGVWCTVAALASRGSFASSGAMRASSPNSRKRAAGSRSRAMSAPCSTIAGAWSPPIASTAIVMLPFTGRSPRTLPGRRAARPSSCPAAARLHVRRNGRRTGRGDAAASARRNPGIRHRRAR